MRIPAIQDLKNHVIDARTRDSIVEVLSCFYSNNLRSAVVMLYATVISDVYYKICDLVDIYNDIGAKQIKDYVDNEWTNHNTSPAWENVMPEKCRKMNRIFNNDSYAHFCQLQTERNLCAHPMITSNDLYRPNSAYVQGLIINMMNGILCKPSFLHRDFFDIFTDDIERTSTIFCDDKKLTNYIKTKYLDKIDNECEEYNILKKLWKFVFEKTDEKFENNRYSNYVVLCEIYERHQDFNNDRIRRDVDYFRKSINLNNYSCTKIFICFANKYQCAYQMMSEDFKMEFDEVVNKNEELKAMAFCISTGCIMQHARSCSRNLNTQTARYVFNYITINVGEKDAIDYIVDLYGNSSSFDEADARFDCLVQSELNKMSEKQLINLVSLSDANNQIYDRRRARKACEAIKECLLNKNPIFDFSPYRNFHFVVS